MSRPLAPGTIAEILRLQRLPVVNYMPPEGREFRAAAYVGIPLQGATAVVVQIKVPQGFNGVINYFANVYVGGGFVEGAGFLTWTLYQDYQQGVVAPGFNNILASLGSVPNPAHLNGIKIKENQLPTLTVSNAAVGIVPAGQLIGGLIGGYFYPVSQEPKTFTF
jgi:hypothetical protein